MLSQRWTRTQILCPSSTLTLHPKHMKVARATDRPDQIPSFGTQKAQHLHDKAHVFIWQPALRCADNGALPSTSQGDLCYYIAIASAHMMLCLQRCVVQRG